MPLRLTTWNLEWFGKLLQGRERDLRGRRVTTNAGRALQQLQKERIAEEIRQIDPDILCIQEGPSSGNVGDLRDFCTEHLNGRWTVIERAGGEAYYVRGAQGIWFLVKAARVSGLSPELLPIQAWWEATEAESRVAPDVPGEHQKTWPIVHPWFKPDGAPPGLDLAEEAWDGEGDPPFADLTLREHYHWRHPQTLTCVVDGQRVDFVGVHLKSKRAGDPGDYARAGQLRGKLDLTEEERLLFEAIERVGTEARIKLSTEVTNIRYFIDSRFRHEPHPAIFVLGDMNDGIGKEYFERRYLFHDLISNLQGDVFFARRFLNHALFDFGLDDGENHRWTVRFEDAFDPERPPEILLDHILFTQAVVGADALQRAPVRVGSRAGRVEHGIHEAVNRVFDRRSDHTSDHRPVTVDLQVRGDPVA